MATHFKTASGVLLTILTSITYIVNIYIVKLAELSASTVCLTRGVLQILVFSSIIHIQRKNRIRTEVSSENDITNKENCENEEAEKVSWMQRRKPLLLAVLYGFLTGSLSFSFILGRYLHHFCFKDKYTFKFSCFKVFH